MVATTRSAEHKTSGSAPATSEQFGLGELLPSEPINILVLDDDSAICRLIQEALSHPDFRVTSESDPQQMAAKLEEGKRFHIVILDYVLPGLNTDELLKDLQSRHADAAIIVVTGHPSIESALSCLRAGTYDYITKPFEIGQLRSAVIRCLEQRGLLRMSEEALRESLGNSIRERRKALGLTLAQMADRTKVSLGYLSQIELGKNSASIETLYRVCMALGIRMADLFQAVQKGG